MTFDFDWRAACMDAERRFMDMKNDRDRWQAIAFCRTCEPADAYYCTRHRRDEEGKE